ncbi:hypothetical protein BJ165DRAFT_1611093 [Panaeolus papilionaceus]|nr:hypothetical protein BJ165DRAFT_1611093 [Panaeolus papilionaceus]
MDYVIIKGRLFHAISLLACCSVAWLAYIRYNHKCDSSRCSFPRARTKAGWCVRSTVVPAQPKLENLSLDVLLEIMAYLEWHELIKLRQVSSGLQLATHQRVLWYNLIRSSPSRYMLKKRIQVCSSQELEEAFLGMQQANRRWVHPQAATPQRVEQMVGLGDVWSFNYKILPGGRWLIKLDATFELLYTDLDSPGPTVWCSLVPPSISADGYLIPWTPLHMLFDLNSNEEYLSFTFVTTTSTPTKIPGIGVMNFNVWRCVSDFHEDGREIGLKALKVSAFGEQNLSLDPEMICTRGDYVAYLDGKSRCPVVVNWKLANGHAINPPSFRFTKNYGRLADLHVLPKTKQVLCRLSRSWDFMSWDNVTPTSSFDHDPSRPVDAKVRSVMDPPRFFADGLELFVQDNAASFIGRVSNTIVRASFDTAFTSPFILNEQVLIDTLPLKLRCYSAVNRAVLFSMNMSTESLDIVTCRYDESNVSQNRHSELYSWGHILPLEYAKRAILDEVSGRCLILVDVGECCYLVDF